jgi:hypothetical protein
MSKFLKKKLTKTATHNRTMRLEKSKVMKSIRRKTKGI